MFDRILFGEMIKLPNYIWLNVDYEDDCIELYYQPTILTLLTHSIHTDKSQSYLLNLHYGHTIRSS